MDCTGCVYSDCRKESYDEQITDMQFRRICRFLKENRELMSRLLNVKVNLSSLDLMRNDCSSHFIRMMDEYEIRHEWIQFEITETVATEYSTSLGMVVDGLTAAGIRLCLDDFGSGYANLNTVMQLPFSTIKLDRSLLFDICNDEKRAQFYQSVVETFLQNELSYCFGRRGDKRGDGIDQQMGCGYDSGILFLETAT